MRFNRYLLEKIANISIDVNNIYNKYFAEFVKAVDKQDTKKLKVMVGKKIFGKINSSELKSPDAIKSHKVNPVDIYLGVDKAGSYYNFVNKVIFISANFPATKFLVDYEFDLGLLSKPFQRSTILRELSEISIKGSISHELAHWVDDSFYNHSERFKPFFSKNRESVARTFTKGKTENINLTNFELNACIQSFDEIKRAMSQKEYDKLTFIDVITLKPSLGYLFSTIGKKEEYDWYIKKFIKRLNREGLLGKSMRILPYKAISSIVN